MWCNECNRHHSSHDFCSSCGTCLIGEYGYPNDDKDYCIRLVMCLSCNALNTMEYNTTDSSPDDGPPIMSEMKKAFDELWEGDV